MTLFGDGKMDGGVPLLPAVAIADRVAGGPGKKIMSRKQFFAPALVKGTPNRAIQRGDANKRASVKNPTWNLINYAKKFRTRLLESAPHLKDPMYRLLVAAIVDAELLHLSLMRGLKRDGMINPTTGELRKAVAEARQQLRAQLNFY